MLQLKEVGDVTIEGEKHTIYVSPVFTLLKTGNKFTLHRFVNPGGTDYSAIYDDAGEEIGSVHREREYDMILNYMYTYDC